MCFVNEISGYSRPSLFRQCQYQQLNEIAIVALKTFHLSLTRKTSKVVNLHVVPTWIVQQIGELVAAAKVNSPIPPKKLILS